MTVAIPRPPRLADVPEPGARDALRLVWWARRGYEHGIWAGRGAGRAFSAVLAILWWPALPLSLPVQLVLLRRRRARYYISPSRDAVLAVVATGRGWHVEDHASARPGTGQGRALRAYVLPELTAAADAAGIPIYTTAANEHLAQQYAEELPGLVDVGRGRPRGRRLHRPPAQGMRTSQ